MHPLKKAADSLPRKAGVYVFKNVEGEIVYIGKARSLRDRVKSYFLPGPDIKVRSILAESASLDYILTDSEKEAFFLESNTIKTYQPKYNLKLKDDKSFPIIRIPVSSPFPGVYLRRGIEDMGVGTYGPFIPAMDAHRLLRLVSRFFRLRTCEDAVFRTRRRPCLAYDLALCSGPCAGRITEAAYAEDVRNARLFLEGRTSELVPILTGLMNRAAESLHYEEAARWRDFLKALASLREKPRFISVSGETQDVVGFARQGELAAFHIFLMKDGKVRRYGEALLHGQHGEDADSLGEFLSEFYETGEIPGRLVLPFKPSREEERLKALENTSGKKIRIVVPKSGKPGKLLDLATRNAESLLRKNEDEASPLIELAHIAGLPAPPARIDGFDISNTGGEESVASMVVFRNGKPDRKEYRKFRIRTVSGPDDFASLEEVLLRRYRRVIGENRERPDCVFVDGGKGQRGAAVRAISESGIGSLPVISLAKKEEILFTPVHPNGIRLPRTSAALKLVQRVRDEAHRFAIAFHRKRRAKKSLESELEGIPGLGPVRRTALLTWFRSLDGIRSASFEDLAGLVGRKTAEVLVKALGGL